MKVFDLDPDPHMSPTMGLLHATVKYNFRRLKRLVNGLTQENIDFKGLNGKDNSIAQLLRHLAVVDLHWVYRLQSANVSNELIEKYGPMYDKDGKLPEITGIPIEKLLAEYELIQDQLREVCLKLTDEDLNREVAFENGNRATIRWGAWHIADHSRHHYANIVSMKKIVLTRSEIMSYQFNRDWLIKKFSEIQRRTLKAIDHLNDDQINWIPNETCHSIATIIKHIEGNIQERVARGILHMNISRDRKQELSHSFLRKQDLIKIVQEGFQFLIVTIRELPDEQWKAMQIVREKERSNLDLLHQCAAHYSEHMGQIFYIAKQLLQNNYKSTSI